MYRYFFVLVSSLLFNVAQSQTALDTVKYNRLQGQISASDNTNSTAVSSEVAKENLTAFYQNEEELLRLFKKYCQYGDAHIHPTYKHYFQPRTADEMKRILSAAKYGGPKNHLIGFDTTIGSEFRNRNWEPYKTSKTAIRNGKVATIGAYEQSGYPEIKYVPGSVFINSYSPYEKQFALKGIKRLISSWVVSGMGSRRLKTYSLNEHTPYHDFLAEYLFNLMQKEEDKITTWSPDFLYRQDGKTYYQNPVYYNRIKMVRDGKELDSILAVNEQAFANWKSFADTPHIITPMVMSVEGAQVLYGTKSGAAAQILNPLNIQKPGTKFFKGVDTPEKLKMIRDEILDNVDSIKNLPHRLFCIILGHFAQNHVVGFAKTLDRDPENIQHRAIATLTRSSPLRNDMIRKTYDGFNPGCEETIDGCVQTNFGLQVVDSFLSTHNIYSKPTYIDVKHMDIKARIQYYYHRREYERDNKVHIPIIASHFAVSGEKQALAVATGLRPNFDRYDETEDQMAFYRHHIFKNNDTNRREEYWTEFMRGDNYPLLNEKKQVLDSFERAMYKPMNFLNKTMFTDTSAYDPFKHFKLDSEKLGWYYPWSINLFDEEIIEISKSGGFIGVMLDPRQLGAYMPKSRKIQETFGNKFDSIIKIISNTATAHYGLTVQDVSKIEYFKTEPMIRNIFYIIQTIKNQQAAESVYKSIVADPKADSVDHKALVATRIKYPEYVADSSFCEKDAWETITIGGDFDGFIDPLDYCPTASYIPLLHKRMVLYAYIFAQIHKNDFHEPDTMLPLITSLEDSDKKMQQFFFSNLQGFIKEYF